MGPSVSLMPRVDFPDILPYVTRRSQSIKHVFYGLPASLEVICVDRIPIPLFPIQGWALLKNKTSGSFQCFKDLKLYKFSSRVVCHVVHHQGASKRENEGVIFNQKTHNTGLVQLLFP